MTSFEAQPWYDDFVLPSRLPEAEFQARVRRGDILRVRSGVWIRASAAAGLDDRARHLVRMRAAVLARSRELVFSHQSAAAAWGLPMLDRFPERVHALAERAGGGRSDADLVRHCVDIPRELMRKDGLLVTTPARTAIDLGRTLDLASAVVTMDAVLAGRCGAPVSRGELASLLGPRRRRGVARAATAVDFADGRSASPGESLSRVTMRLAGVARPELQVCFTDRQGRMIVDFWWPRHRVAGEFDGLGKYLRDEFTGGRSPAEVVIAEKRREDRLRALDVRVVRWGMHEARSPSALAAILPPAA